MSDPTSMSADELAALLGDLAMPDLNEPEAKAPSVEPDHAPEVVVAAAEPEPTPEPAPVTPEASTLEDDLAALESLQATATPAPTPEPEPVVETTAAPVVTAEDVAAAAVNVKVAAPEPKPEPITATPIPEAATVTATLAPPPAPAPVDRVGEVAKPTLTTFVDSDQLKRDVRINPTDLDNAMMEHPSLFVHYATQAVNARRQHDRMKNSFEVLEARLDAEYREKFVAEGKKVTEAQIKAAVTTDARWAKGQAMVIEAHSIWRLAEIAQSAFDQRRDLLLEVARDRRKEKEGNMRVLEAQNQRDRVLEMMGASKAA